jgi:hypothetical protein
MRWPVTAVLALALTAAPANARTIHPRSGDWEAANPAGSFELGHGRLTHIVLVVPETCHHSGQTPTTEPHVGLFHGRVTVSRSGRVAGRLGSGATLATIRGRFTSRRAATFTYRLRDTVPDPLFGGTLTCDAGPQRLSFAPGTRPAIRTGVWKGTGADGEGVSMRVAEGGRVLEGDPTADPTPGAFTFGTFKRTCSGSQCDIVGLSRCAEDFLGTVFIAPNGAFDSGSPFPGQEDRVSGAFDSPTDAHGQWTEGVRTGCDSAWSAHR